MRIAITGAGGRLGRALLAALEGAPFTGPFGPLAWSRPDFDLDDPSAAARVVGRDVPEVVIHAAAWTDVDGCAREPGRAMRRNALAVAELAEACVIAGTDLVLVSTNEVFDGRRTDGRGYAPGDRPAPVNPYGASKLAGESAAQAAFLRRGGVLALGGGAPPAGPQLAIVRTSWLFGPPGNDFPGKILAAAERARAAGEPLRVTGDEIGSPTYAPDLADAITELLAGGAYAGFHHVVNGGAVSRAAWARTIIAAAGLDVPVTEVPLASWARPSAVPAWAVLAPTPLPTGEPLRPWQAALADYLPTLLLGRAPAVRS
ncbi:MAG: NAD(P)-dependent oxidoreductase [Chloroflexota bacterium]